MKSENYKNSLGEEIDFTVYVTQRPNLRNDEMLAYMGIVQLKEMFDECKINPETIRIHLEYPERWANILELRAIPDRMLAAYPNLKSMTIKTHSVYIVQCVHRQHILVDDVANKFPEKGYGDLSIRYCDPPNGEDGLMCFGGTIKCG